MVICNVGGYCMSRGKKFDAAEKHFQKIRLQYEHRLNRLATENANLRRQLSVNTEKLHNIEIENEQLKEWVERLLQYTELSKEDIKIVCQKDKDMASAVNMVSSLLAYM